MKQLILLFLFVLIYSIIPFKGTAQKLKRTSDGWEQVAKPSAAKDSVNTGEFYTYKDKKYIIWLSAKGSAYAWIPKAKSEGMRKFYLGKEQNAFYQKKMGFKNKKPDKK